MWCNGLNKYMIIERIYEELRFQVNDDQDLITSSDIRVDLYLIKSCIITQANSRRQVTKTGDFKLCKWLIGLLHNDDLHFYKYLLNLICVLSTKLL